MLESTINIPNSEFDLHELVTLHYNGSFDTRIVKRTYDPDRQEWLYEVSGRRDLYSCSVLERRQSRV